MHRLQVNHEMTPIPPHPPLPCPICAEAPCTAQGLGCQAAVTPLLQRHYGSAALPVLSPTAGTGRVILRSRPSNGLLGAAKRLERTRMDVCICGHAPLQSGLGCWNAAACMLVVSARQLRREQHPELSRGGQGGGPHKISTRCQAGLMRGLACSRFGWLGGWLLQVTPAGSVALLS